MVGRQRIYVGMEGISVDLDHKSVWKTIEKYKVEDEVACFEKVLATFEAVREMEELERPK